MSDLSIDVIEINDHLKFFYWGRDADHESFDLRLGGGSFAVHRGESAIVVDTMTRPGQGAWVKRYLETECGIRRFRVINTHWHIDHVIDNVVYRGEPIVGHKFTRDRLLELRPRLEQGLDTYPPFEVEPPNLTFEGRLDLWLGDLEVQLHELEIHARGHVCALLPREHILLAADMLEDPIWIFDFDVASPAHQLAELDRLAELDADRIYPCHCDLERVRSGGYGKDLVRNNADYLRRMLADLDDPDFDDRPAQHYLGGALERRELAWWEPYSEVHSMNRQALKRWREGRGAG